jgi:sodium transport system ATP-binding protein
MPRVNASLIECHGLTKHFPGVEAVRDVDLAVLAGEVVGLLGPNGAGKTTTLRMLAAVLQPTAGRAAIAGHDTQKAPLEAKARLGFLTGNTALYARLSPREMLDYFGRLHDLDAPTRRARTDTLVHELQMEDFANRPCGKLSSGQQQRANIARTLVHDPPALILDEPTASLDVISGSFILEFIRRARGRGKAVLFSTHIMSEAELLCDRVLLIHRGRIITQGTVPEICAVDGTGSLTAAFLHHVARADAEGA